MCFLILHSFAGSQIGVFTIYVAAEFGLNIRDGIGIIRHQENNATKMIANITSLGNFLHAIRQ